MIVDAGAHSVIADFNNIDDVGGNLMTMAKQVRSAVAWVYNNAQKFGGDKNRLYVTGHSSGGHLASTHRHLRLAAGISACRRTS